MKSVDLGSTTVVCSKPNSRVNSIINNDPLRFERPFYRPTTCYILLLAMQLTAIIVMQFGFISIIISFELFNFLPLPCLSLTAYACTVIGLYRPCKKLLLPHIFVESIISICYFVIAIVCIKDYLIHDPTTESSVFKTILVKRALKFGIFLLIGVPFQLFFILAVFKRYYLGSF